LSTIPQDAVTAAVSTSKAVVILDHIKNNRVEWLIVIAIGTMMGWTAEALSYAQGVCA
jgi:hypothetical protein